MGKRMNSSTCVIIPAYNEATTIREVVTRCKNHADSVVVVDDGSTDGTQDLARSAGAIVLEHIINCGKGVALRTGCEYARSRASRIVLIDADMQHDPEDIPRMLAGLENHDIVFGYRSFNERMPGVFRLGNTFFTRIASILYGMPLNDILCGYKAFRTSAYPHIEWVSSGYSVESEIAAKTSLNKLRYTQVAIETRYLDAYKGTSVLDGVSIIKDMIWFKTIR